MEASIAEPTAWAAPEEGPPPEIVAWWAEVEKELPAGDELTDQKLRVDYLLERVALEEEARAEVAEFTARRVAMVTDHGDREMARIDRRIQHLRARIAMNLPPSAEGFREAFGKKSVSLPHGEVGFSASRESLVIQDPNAALGFAKDAGLEIGVKEFVNKTPLHEHFKATGEIPTGCEVVPGKDVFFVKPKGGA